MNPTCLLCNREITSPFYEPNIFGNIDQCIGCNEWSTGRYIIEWGDDDD